MLRNIIVPVLVASYCSTALADTEIGDSVPLELVKAFLGATPFGEPTIFSDLSSAFPEIEVPDEFEIMGSIERGYSISAVYSTALSSSQTQSTLNEAFVKAEYMEFDLPRMRRGENGFVSSSVNIPQRYNRYCHDSLGFLSLNYSEKEQGGTVTISASPTNDNRSCADQLAEQQLAMSRMGGPQGGIHQYLPRMELPETEPRRLTPFSGLGGWSSSTNREIESKANLRIDWEIEDVYSHFSEQISDQGWVVDAENIGTASAIGSWTRSPEPGTDLIGTLTIYKSSEESFELKFQLLLTGARNGIGFGIFRAN